MAPSKTTVTIGGDVEGLRLALQSAADTTAETSDEMKAKFAEVSAKFDEVMADIEATAKRTRPAITVDDDVALERLADVKARLAALSEKVTSARVEVSDADGQAKLSEIEATLDRLDHKTSSPRVTIGGIADTEAKLHGLELELDKIGTDDTAVAGLDKTTEKLQDTKKAADDASGVSSGEGISGITAAAITLGPALVPLGAVAAGAVATIGGAFLSAGAGLGAFGLAAAGSLSKVEAQASAALAGWQKAMAPVVTPVLLDAVKLVGPALNDLTPLVDATAKALGKVVTDLADALNSPAMHGFITFLSGQAGPAITAFTNFFGGLGEGIAGMVEQTGPLLTGFEGLLTRMGKAMSGMGSSKGFESFIAYVQKEGPLVGKTLEDMGKAFGEILKAAAPVGVVVLKLVDDVSKLVAGVGKAHPGLLTGAIAIAGIGVAGSKALSGVEKLGTKLQSLGNMAKSAGGFAKTLAQQLGLIHQPATGAASDIEGIGKSMEDAETDTSTASSGILESIGTGGGIALGLVALGLAAYELYENWGTVWSGITGVASEAASGLSDTWNDIDSGTSTTWDDISSGTSSAWSTITSTMSGAWSTINSDVSNGVSTAMNTLTDMESDITNTFSDAITWLLDAGEDIISGLVNGLTEGVTDLPGIIGSLAEDIINDFTSALGIFSPSTVMAEKVGKWIPAGIAVGITENRAVVDAATRATIPDMSAVGGTARTAGINLGSVAGVAPSGGGVAGYGASAAGLGSGDLVVQVQLGNSTQLAQALVPSIRQQLARNTSRNAVQARLTK